MANPNDKDCCNDSPFLPKSAYSGKYGRKSLFTDLPNPIPKEVTDPEDIKLFFKNYPFIPYAGTETNTNHSLINWLDAMRSLSPTHGSCINSIKSYALGDKLDLKKYNPDFHLDDDNLEDGLKEEMLRWLSSTIRLDYNNTLHGLSLSCFEELEKNGNYFLELVIYNIDGKYTANIILHETSKVCYVVPKPNQPRYVGISHQWGDGYIKVNPPRILPVYPQVSNKNNVLRTIIHVKEETTNLYGRPHWLHAFMPIYQEYQHATYMIKLSANNFAAQVLLEVEDADGGDGNNVFDDEQSQKDGFANAQDQFKRNFTAAADDPDTAILLSRPYGSRPVFVHEFKPQLNENFYKTMGEMHELDIIRAHQWSKRFLGENQTQGFSKDVFLDELKVKEAKMLPYLRGKAVKGINVALNVLSQLSNPKFLNIGVCGRNSLDSLKEMIVKEDMLNGLAINKTELNKNTNDDITE